MNEDDKNLKTIDTQFGKIVININDQFIGKSFLNQKYWALQDIETISKIIEFKCKKKNKIVSAAFSQRRKMLRNTLKSWDIPKHIQEDIDFRRRPETLSIDEFASMV